MKKVSILEKIGIIVLFLTCLGTVYPFIVLMIDWIVNKRNSVAVSLINKLT